MESLFFLKCRSKCGMILTSGAWITLLKCFLQTMSQQKMYLNMINGKRHIQEQIKTEELRALNMVKLILFQVMILFSMARLILFPVMILFSMVRLILRAVMILFSMVRLTLRAVMILFSMVRLIRFQVMIL